MDESTEAPVGTGPLARLGMWMKTEAVHKAIEVPTPAEENNSGFPQALGEFGDAVEDLPIGRHHSLHLAQGM